jgi:hypothetical protein
MEAESNENKPALSISPIAEPMATEKLAAKLLKLTAKRKYIIHNQTSRKGQVDKKRSQRG